MIRHKGIFHERTEDAPFTGALISACGCRIGCKNCFNEHIKAVETRIQSPESILDEVEMNIFNDGIILAGLEWSLQPKELITLTKEAIRRNLKVMIYTGYDKKNFHI